MMILNLVLISVILLFITIPIYAETINYKIIGNYHDYKIELEINDKIVNGEITNNDKVITLNNLKLIERDNSKYLIIDTDNKLKILLKEVKEDRYLVIIKIQPDIRLRFVSDINVQNKNINQRDLFNDFTDKQKLDEEIKNISAKELELNRKESLIEKTKKQLETDIQNMIEDDKRYSHGNLDRQSILDNFEKHKIKTGMDKIVPEKIIKPKVTVIDNRELYVLTNHYDKVSNNQNDLFRFAVKTFDKNIYAGTEWNHFNGKLDDVSITATIKDSDGNIKKQFLGITKYGIFEDQIKISELSYPQGNYNIEINAKFKNQNFKDTLYFVIYEDSTPFNNRPITNAGDDLHYKSGDLAQLSGSKSHDQDDTNLFYTWNQINGTKVKLSNNKIVNPTFTIPDSIDSFIFELLVDDGRKKSNNLDRVTVTSLHADAGENLLRINGTDDFKINSTNITLDGSKSGDALHDDIDFDWSFLNVPENSKIDKTFSKSQNPKFIPDRLGNYTLQLIIDDKLGLKDIDEVTITVKNPF